MPKTNYTTLKVNGTLQGRVKPTSLKIFCIIRRRISVTICRSTYAAFFIY